MNTKNAAEVPTNGIKESKVVIDGSGMRSGKTRGTLREVLSKHKPREVVILLPKLGDPLDSTDELAAIGKGCGLAASTYGSIKNFDSGIPVIGSFGRNKMCIVQQREGEKGNGSLSQEELYKRTCEACPANPTSDEIKEQVQAEAEALAESPQDFWSDAWKHRTEADPPSVCAPKVAKELEQITHRHARILSTQSLANPPPSNRHLERFDIEDRARDVAQNRVIIFDESHHLETLFEIQAIDLTHRPHLPEPTLKELHEPKDRQWGFLGSPPGLAEFSQEDQRQLEQVAWWVHEGMENAIRFYRIQTEPDFFDEDPKSNADFLNAMKQMPEYKSPNGNVTQSKPRFVKNRNRRVKNYKVAGKDIPIAIHRSDLEEDIRKALDSCSFTTPCFVCNAIDAWRKKPPGDAQGRRWAGLLNLASRLLAGEAVFYTTPSRKDQKAPIIDSTWSFQLKVLDAHYMDDEETEQTELYVRHTVLRTIAQSASRLYLLSATQLSNAVWKATLGNEHPEEGIQERYPDMPRVEILVEQATRSIEDLQTGKQVWDELIRPLVEVDNPPFVFARNKSEFEVFKKLFPNHPKDRMDYLRGPEAEGTQSSAPYVLFLGPPLRPIDVKPAVFLASLDEIESNLGQPSSRFLGEINDAAFDRSLTEAAYQAAARTSSKEKGGGKCVILSCHPKTRIKMEAAQYPWLTKDPSIIKYLDTSGSALIKNRRYQIWEFVEGRDPFALSGAEFAKWHDLVEAVHSGGLKQPFNAYQASEALGGKGDQWGRVFKWAEGTGRIERIAYGKYRLLHP